MFDFCINGAGMVGAATALGLARQGYSVAIIEPDMPQAYSSEQEPDIRLSAISLASVQLLDELGAWEPITQMRVRPYTKLSVWENNDCRTDFEATELGVERLGYFVENRLIQLGCHKAMANHSNITWFTGERVTHISLPLGQQAVVELANGSLITATWLIGADGANSQVREAANIGVTGWQYSQQAMGIVVRTHTVIDDWTWQQFHPSGPRALLPMYDNYASLIWYDDSKRISALMAMSDAALLAEVKAAFPAELVDCSIVKKAAFPLIRRQASHYVKPNVILLGDAAHTINPLAGQGVNLGFKDVKALLAFTQQHPNLNDTEFTDQLKRDVEQPRRRDCGLMMSAMDGFYWLFSNDSRPLSLLRNAALKAAQHAGPVKREVLKYAMGLK